MVVVAPSEVSDENMMRAREIVAAMLSGKPDLLGNTAPKYIRIVIYKVGEEIGGISQLPEFRAGQRDHTGATRQISSGWISIAPEGELYCPVFIHEFAHAIHFVLGGQPGGPEFRSRLGALYHAALRAGLWQGANASTNVGEYWAETVTFWFREFIRHPSEPRDLKLEDYDPEIAKLIAETFGNASVPSYCKP